MRLFSLPKRHRLLPFLRHLHHKPKPKPSPPPSPPNPPHRPKPFSLHGHTWLDPYSWMSDLHDPVASRHLQSHLDLEHTYLDAVMASSLRLRDKIQSEMAVRMATELCSPPVKWGPWIYYRRVEEGRQYTVLCRRNARVQEEFVSIGLVEGFDFQAGRRIEQKLLDYNEEAERFGGYAYEERSEVSPDHRYLAYTMFDKDKKGFTLCIRDLLTKTLCDHPKADRVAQLAWAMDGKALLYTIRDEKYRPHRIYCSFIGSNTNNLILEERDEAVYVNIRNTKDFRFITVNMCSNTFTKVYLINAANPLNGMSLVWECDEKADCIIEHHQGRLYLFTNAAWEDLSRDSYHLLYSDIEVSSCRRWKNAIADEPILDIKDVDICNTHLVLILKEGKDWKLCSVSLPIPVHVKETPNLVTLQPCFLDVPKHVCQISPGPNYDFYSSIMRFTVSSPVMPDAVVEYNLINGKWSIVQQQNLLYERTQTLYGTSAAKEKTSVTKKHKKNDDVNPPKNLWNDLSEFYSCEFYEVPSKDGVLVPMTVVRSGKQAEEGNPGLLHGHGAYGEILDKRWNSELKSMLDRGWVMAYADVRGGGGLGKKWHQDGWKAKKENSVADYVSCAKFLVEKGIVQENKLAGWGYSAGGLLVASAINTCPDLFQAAVLKVPFLDPCGTLLNPVLQLNPQDYEEFGNPENFEDFQAIRKYSPYDNINKSALYPAVLVTASFNTRFGAWEAAKWVARVREQTFNDPERPILLNLTMDMMEESKYLQSKELALESAFLIKMVVGS